MASITHIFTPNRCFAPSTLAAPALLHHRLPSPPSQPVSSQLQRQLKKLYLRTAKPLKAKGIAQEDVQTTVFNVNPQFERRPAGDMGDIIGYRVSNEVDVKVRNLDILGGVLDALVSAGSNRISSVNFGTANPKPLLNKAREQAVGNAKSRANLYANAAGVRLGKIISISETPISEEASNSRISAGAVGSAPIATGELNVTATVFILFGIGEK